jgi:serine/threonine-protein kinase
MAQDTELAGHVLGGKYRLVRNISDGPRKVYEARHERLAGRFAVKQWPATTPWDAFRRGAEVAMMLRHPGIMQVVDFNCEPGVSPFLVLEWVEGKRLSQVIVESGILPIERVAPLIESAAWALASAHQQGVVHKELRPDEIFVVHAPGTMREWVKVAGFGVGAALARVGLAPPSRYRAPEQTDVAVDDDDDPQSDQYALAAIAYEMLAGVPPFDEQHSKAEPLPISDLAPGVSPAIDAAIRQALATEPEQRFASVLDFARTLRDAVEGASPETISRRREDGRTRAKSGRDREPISPFFNPLQGATDAIRRVAGSTARLRTLAGSRWKAWPAPASKRIALAGGALLLAFAGAAVVSRRAPSEKAAPAPAAPTVAVSPAPAPAPAEPAPPVPAPAPEAVPPPAPPAAAPPTAEAPAAQEASPAEDAPAADTRAAAWARLASGGRVKKPPPARTAPAAVKIAAAPKPAAARPAPAPVPKKVAAAAPAAGGPCVMSVGSRPPADVWIDEKNLGRRTPLAAYHLACGDHKLVLKRADLDIYQMEMITLKAGAHFKKVYPLQ